MPADQDDRAALPGEPSHNGAPMPPSWQISDKAGLAGGMRNFIIKNPNVLGGADIYNLDVQNPQSRAGMLIAVLTRLVDDNRRPGVRNFVVVVPPGMKETDCEVQTWSEIVSTFRLLAGRDMKPSEQDWIRARFRIHAAQDSWSRSALAIIEGQSERTAVIVTDAASYRDANVDPYVAPSALTPLRSEDVWVPHLHALAVAAVELAQKRLLYVALDANHLSPRREALSELLLSIDGCGVMGSSNEVDPDSILAGRVDQWDEWIRAGRLGRALSDVEQLPATLDENKPYLRIQLIHRAGHFPLALKAIREKIASDRTSDASSRVKLARMAEDANASMLANEILAPTVEVIDSHEDLESALATAHEAGSTDLEERIAERHGAKFPGSSGLRQRRRRSLLVARDYAGVAAMAAEEPDGQASTEFYDRLARFLSGPDVPDYDALIASAGGDITQVDAYRMACVSDALARQLVFHAFDFAVPIPMTPAQSERGERLLLEVLEAILLLAGKDGAMPVPSEQVQAAVLSLIERLAANPDKQALRLGLTRLVQPSLAGMTGLALMASVVLHLASRPIRLQKRGSLGKANADWLLEHNQFLDAALGWMKGEAPLVIGRFVLPERLLTEPADEIASAIADYLTHAPLDSEEDTAAHQLWLGLAASVTPHCSDSDFDLRLIRLVAGKLVSSGYTQPARDLAEQALLNSTTSPQRRRLGWFAMADVYHRCSNHLEGLLAIACTLVSDHEGDEEQVFHEITGIARLFRDCGLYDESRSAIEKARQLLQRMELSDTNSHRLDTLELQIRQMRQRTKGSDNPGLEALLVDVVRNGAAVLEIRDKTEPVAAMLGQLLHQAREADATIPPEADNVLTELCKRAEGNPALLIGAISATAPSADKLLSLLKTSGSARYSDDVGYDARNSVIVASRALANDEYIGDAVDTSFALELLADRGVALPGWDEAPEPPPVPNRVDEPAELACSISQDGISVVQAGFDTLGQLVRVSAIGGCLEAAVREPDDIMNQERFERWSVEYPHAYGIDETTANLFYTTTADLRLSGLPEGPVVVIADAGLQSFPPNLFYVEEEFAGRTRPMAAAPSLAWLQAARMKGMIGDGRLCSWISTAVRGTERQTLPMIAQRLEPTFAQYNVMADNGSTLPAAFAGASMAVITAHGEVHPEGRYFQVVSDDGSLRVTAGDLANALRNIGIVILFVCSGGRADKHPGANTTIGLAKQILDRGCAATIASPWPLDARVPSHWLPEFMHHWSQGESLIEANFAANQVIDQRFSKGLSQITNPNAS